MILTSKDIPSKQLQVNMNWGNHEECGFIFQTKDFFYNEDYWEDVDSVDILTFSVTLAHGRYSLPFRINRCVVGNLSGLSFSTSYTRFCPKLHTKLYIAYKEFSFGRKKKTPIFAYIGSLNFVTPTHIELIYKIKNKKALKELVEYFNYIWNLSKPTNI